MGIRTFTKSAYKEIKNLSIFKKEAHYFLLISQERTGSTLLSDLISFHPSILMDRHYFYRPDNWPSRWQEGKKIYSRKPIRGCKFKMADDPYQSSPQEARGFLQTTGADMSIIRLNRNNKFRQGLSSYLADLRDKIHERSDEENSPDKKFRIDPDHLIEDYIKYFEKLTDFQDQALNGTDYCEVTYELDLKKQDRHQATANRVFRHLDLDLSPVETRFKKMTPFDLSKIISNPDEVKARLSKSPYGKYLSPNRDQVGSA